MVRMGSASDTRYYWDFCFMRVNGTISCLRPRSITSKIEYWERVPAASTAFGICKLMAAVIDRVPSSSVRKQLPVYYWHHASGDEQEIMAHTAYTQLAEKSPISLDVKFAAWTGCNQAKRGEAIRNLAMGGSTPVIQSPDINLHGHLRDAYMM